MTTNEKVSYIRSRRMIPAVKAELEKRGLGFIEADGAMAIAATADAVLATADPADLAAFHDLHKEVI